MTGRRAVPYWNQKRRNDDPRVDGMSHRTLAKQRGLKGCKLGPASEGRRLTDVEKAEIEARMKREGRL